MNLARNLERSALYFPDRPAVTEENQKISYFEFNQKSNQVATALIGLGVKPGDPVALCSPNSSRWLTFYFGVLKIGAVAVTLSSALPKNELTQSISDARPKVMFTIDEKLNDLGNRRDLDYLECIISPKGDISYERLIERGSRTFKAVELRRTDVAAIPYTGGTEARG